MKNNICEVCYYQLCDRCVKNVNSKDKNKPKNKISLRNYAIPTKNLKTLHFDDC